MGKWLYSFGILHHQDPHASDVHIYNKELNKK